VFFVITNYIETPNQRLGFCAEVSIQRSAHLIICFLIVWVCVCLCVCVFSSILIFEITVDESVTDCHVHTNIFSHHTELQGARWTMSKWRRLCRGWAGHSWPRWESQLRLSFPGLASQVEISHTGHWQSENYISSHVQSVSTLFSMMWILYIVHTVPAVLQLVLLRHKLSLGSTQRRMCALSLSVRNNDWVVFKQHWDLWDSLLVSCWVRQETHVSPPPPLAELFKCAILCYHIDTHSDPSQGPRYFTSSIYYECSLSAPLVLFLFHTAASLSVSPPPLFLSREPLLSEAENFTIYIKNFIRFPKFEFSKWVSRKWCLLPVVSVVFGASWYRSLRETQRLLWIALGCREPSIYTSLCIALSETVKQSSETSLTAGLALDRCPIRRG